LFYQGFFAFFITTIMGGLYKNNIPALVENTKNTLALRPKTGARRTATPIAVFVMGVGVLRKSI
jgi:hypothetical protein